MKQSWWQILPLGPTGAGDSPYQAFSAFAGNTALLSPELLERDGLISSSSWQGERFPDEQVDYPRVTAFKERLLRQSWNQFKVGGSTILGDSFHAYCHSEVSWLDDYALYMAIRHSLRDVGLADWPDELLEREPAALTAARQTLSDEIAFHQFGQFLFDRQWSSLKEYARERRIGILGDSPIFIALDSADVWANPELFLLGPDRKPTVVAGVPPDYFCIDGQHWGNPIYDWSRLEKTGFRWWVERLRRQLNQVDLVRLDHFRGFVQAWHVPAGEKTARNGKWIDGPGLSLFDQIRTTLGKLPLVAEDLGLITPDVIALREKLNLPGMRVLQFALSGPDNLHWPHNFVRNCICYTGTHDNDTSSGWYATLSQKDRHYLGLMLGHYVDDPAWELLRMAWASVAMIAIVPYQDVLSLGSDARMNRPGVADGNWRWRFRLDQCRPEVASRLADLTGLYNRAPQIAGDTTPVP